MVKREGMENLLLKYYEGETTEDETALVEEWLEASEENRRTARQVQTLGLAADMAQISSRLDVKKALEDVHRKMKQKKVNRYRVLFRGMQRAAAILLAADMAQISSRLDVKKALEDVHRKMKQKKVNRYRVLFRGMQRAAAILFIPLMVSWSILYWDKDKEEIHMMEVRTNPGMTTSVELPDGTEVVLNSSSSLRYPSRFADDKREVKLVGEAFFSVAKDEKKFIVGTLNNSKIVVHGTEFNVEAYKGSRTVQTTLVSGKVSFSYVNNGRRNNVMMIPGQKVIYDIVREKVVVKEVNVDVETCWKDGRLIFRNTPFEDILKSLSKRYNVEFILKKASLKQNSFTATFTKQRLERILDHFRISSNIHFKFVEDGDVNAERQVIEVY